jgi:hypothetical protein
MKRATALFAIGALLVAISGTASSFDLKGIQLGQPATQAQIEKAFGVSCGAGANGWTICNGDTTVADISGTLNLVLDKRGIVTRMRVRFPVIGFDQVAIALVEKLGAPTAQKHVREQNRMGATFDNAAFEWDDAQGGQVFLERYAGDIDDSALTFSTKSDRDALLNLLKGHSKDL